MNLDQMEYRCPSAQVVGNVRLEDYRLTFCSHNPDRGVATILPETGSHVDGVLWKITQDCEISLDHYEGYPYLYGKEAILVKAGDGRTYESMAYVMNAPHKDCPARPSDFYLRGILEGYADHGRCMPDRKGSESKGCKKQEKGMGTIIQAGIRLAPTGFCSCSCS